MRDSFPYLLPADGTSPKCEVFIGHAMVIMDMDMVCPVNEREEIIHHSHGVRMAEIKSHTDPLDTFCHPDQFLRPAAEEFLYPDHILKAGKYPVIRGNLPDLPERLFLEFPHLLGHELAYR